MAACSTSSIRLAKDTRDSAHLAVGSLRTWPLFDKNIKVVRTAAQAKQSIIGFLPNRILKAEMLQFVIPVLANPVRIFSDSSGRISVAIIVVLLSTKILSPS